MILTWFDSPKWDGLACAKTSTATNNTNKVLLKMCGVTSILMYYLKKKVFIKIFIDCFKLTFELRFKI